MHVVIINGSPRTSQFSNTAKILQAFIQGYEAEGDTCELYSLSNPKEWNAARQAYFASEKIIFALPMYVESIPSLMLEFLGTLCHEANTLGVSSTANTLGVCREANTLGESTERQLPAELSFILHGGFDEGYQFRLCERLLISITSQLGCSYGGCLIKGGSFMLRLFDQTEVEKMTNPYLKMGRSYAWNGDFLTPAARRFTGSERYPWLIRQLSSLVLRMVVNRKFDQTAQEWGCFVPLDYKPFEQ